MDETEIGHFSEYSGTTEDMIGVEVYQFNTLLDHAERIANSTYYSGERWVIQRSKR